LEYELGMDEGYPSDVFFSAFIAVAAEISEFFNSVVAVRERHELMPKIAIVAMMAIITTTTISSTIVKPLLFCLACMTPVYSKH
jgi:hypothetical protein